MFAPGTVIDSTSDHLNPLACIPDVLWASGGLVLSQIRESTGLETAVIQNWVKRGFLAPPRNKRYTLRQLCRILNINMLKGVLPMERICGMLGYINGALDDESDDLIDDSALYFMFVRLAVRARELDRTGEWDSAIAQVLADYQEPTPGAKQRIAQVLRVMVVGYIASRMKQEAEHLLAEMSFA